MQDNINEAELWSQIQEQFERLKKESDIETDEDYKKQIEEIFGLTDEDFQEMDEHTKLMLARKNMQVQMTNDFAIFPSYAYPTDSGFDLFSTEEVDLPPFGRALVSTGLKISFNEGIELQIRPKSGLALNQGITVLNTPGTVDAGYTGEIKVIVYNTNNYNFTIPRGMKIAQGVFAPVLNGRFVNFETVSEIGEKDRGDNGFGSTGI
jgi:dUTP pyrophosphatase